MLRMESLDGFVVLIGAQNQLFTLFPSAVDSLLTQDKTHDTHESKSLDQLVTHRETVKGRIVGIQLHRDAD